MPPFPLRNRIKEHRKVRLGDLVAHELNPRIHSPLQRAVLTQLYQEIGFARSVLAYELPDGRLKLIDGHLRAGLTPDEIVDVEILDVTEVEARTLLLSIDPLAQIAEYEEKELAALREQVEKDSAAVQMLWKKIQDEEPPTPPPDEPPPVLEDQYLIIIECASEAEQVQLLRRFGREGLKCQAKVA
jgi:hypothetical protein